MATKTKARTVKVCRVCGSTQGFDEVVTVAEAATDLGISRQAVAQLIERGELPGAKRETNGHGNPGGRPKWLIPVRAVNKVKARREGRAS